MTHTIRSRFSALTVLALSGLAALTLGSASHAQQVPYVTGWVDAEFGLDTNSGTQALPWRTLTYALNQAGNSQLLIRTIKIQYRRRPIAPAGWGDNNTNLAGREPTTAVPFQMVAGIDIIGIPDPITGLKPRITVNEANGGLYFVLNGPNNYLTGASNCKLDNIELDGRNLRNKQPRKQIGVIATDVQDFEISSCFINDMYDGVFFRQTQQGLTQGAVTNTTISGCFPNSLPTTPLSELLQDRGHAALWLEVTGSGVAGDADPKTPEDDDLRAMVDVTVSGSTFEGCHDAIETSTLAGTSYTKIVLHTEASNYVCGENGIEIVSGGTDTFCDVSVDGCLFLDNYPHPASIGGFVNSPTAAIVHRTKDSRIFVRNTSFKNNSVAIQAAGGAAVDLGTQTPLSKGNNTFCLDTLPAMSDVPANLRYAVILFWSGVDTFTAYGNRWITNNQATNSDGCLYFPTGASCSTGTECSSVGTGLNATFNSSNIWVGPLVSGGLGVDRNYSISGANASSIKFYDTSSGFCSEIDACGGSHPTPPCCGSVPDGDCSQ